MSVGGLLVGAEETGQTIKTVGLHCSKLDLWTQLRRPDVGSQCMASQRKVYAIRETESVKKTGHSETVGAMTSTFLHASVRAPFKPRAKSDAAVESTLLILDNGHVCSLSPIVTTKEALETHIAIMFAPRLGTPWKLFVSDYHDFCPLADPAIVTTTAKRGGKRGHLSESDDDSELVTDF